jgi:hypothetical protein
MNNALVREDIHADKSVEQWDLCNMNIMQNFKRDPAGSFENSKYLLI